jgi:hypothetical protein
MNNEEKKEDAVKQTLIGENSTIGKQYLEMLKEELEEANVIMNDIGLPKVFINNAERRRFLGSGERRYGFIEKTWAMSKNDNEVYYPYFSNFEDLKKILEEISVTRNIIDLVEKIRRISMDHYLLLSDAAYNITRLYYRNIRESARSGDVRAEVIFNDLKSYYAPMGKGKRVKVTEKELLRDVKALLHQKKEGEIVIENNDKWLMINVEVYRCGSLYNFSIFN